MEDETPSPLGQPKPQENTKPNTKKWATWLLAALVVLLLAIGGYLWTQLQSSKQKAQQLTQEKQQLQEQIDQLKNNEQKAAAGDTEETACTYTPGTTLKDNIKAALDSKNTAAFATYVTDPVKYVLAASELGGNATPDEAATNLEYTHSATGPWSYVEDISAYATGDYDDYFGDNTLVAKASSGMVVAFEFNCDGSKISEIFVAADEDLL